jgi:hypothetical protein
MGSNRSCRDRDTRLERGRLIVDDVLRMIDLHLPAVFRVRLAVINKQKVELVMQLSKDLVEAPGLPRRHPYSYSNPRFDPYFTLFT